VLSSSVPPTDNPDPLDVTDPTPTPTSTATPDPSPTPPLVLPTYTYDVHIKPIIQNRCSQCHQLGGVAPFVLSQYSQVKSWGNSILSRVKARIMPPWGAQDDGTCQSFQHSLWMSDSEISILETWVKEKFPEGDPTADIVPDAPTSHYDLTAPDIIEYKMLANYNPSTSNPLDDYRCFITNEYDTNKTITGFDIVTGNPDVVHHVIAYLPSTEDDEALALSKGQGYTCFGGPGVSSSVVAFWAPGTGVTPYPKIKDLINPLNPDKQTGLTIPAGRRVILQVHYNYSAGYQSDQSSVRFKVSSNIVKNGSWLQFGKTSGTEVIPKLTYEYLQVETSPVGRIFAGTDTNPAVPGYLYAVFPHMHQVGSKINIELNRASGISGSLPNNECLVKVPVWDFHWQRVYWFKNPVPVNSLDTLKMNCTYNTLLKNADTHFGEGSTDEMCFMFGFVTDAKP